MLLTEAGIATGIVMSPVLTRLRTSLLFGVKATDVLTYLTAIAIFTVVALLVCYIPARRAAKVDAMIALRYE